jgi:hypothetical protein
MAAPPHRRAAIKLTPTEREFYVRWWIRRSGLTRSQIREIAAGIWSESETVDARYGSRENPDSGAPRAHARAG